MVVSNELKEPIRSHHDIDRDSVKHFKRATKVGSSMLVSKIIDIYRHSSTKVLQSVPLTTDMPSTCLLAVWIRLDCSR